VDEAQERIHLTGDLGGKWRGNLASAAGLRKLRSPASSLAERGGTRLDRQRDDQHSPPRSAKGATDAMGP
jgi:hypothetical protein